MIKYEKGDILEASTEALVNAVNCQGVMGKGIALQFKNEFPNNYIFYKKACQNHEMTVDEVLVYEEKGIFIINFATKQEWRKKSQYDYIQRGLLSLIKKVKKYNIKSIAIPPLGCGNGGLEWCKVEKLIIDAFMNESNIEVVLYPPMTERITHPKLKINVNHVLLNYAYEQLENKTKYALFTTFYLSNALLKRDDFSFSIHHNRAYSKELNDIMESMSEIKDKINDELSVYLYEFTRTNINNEIKNKLHAYIKTINEITPLLNSFTIKEEFIEIVKVIEEIKNGTLLIDENNRMRMNILNELTRLKFIHKNLFGDYSLESNNET
ncbi:macro domain-containing protein [Enterobacter cloacae]|uniref:macro domain-containing protein n=1 Tax=Enterobacteriaceae TaxID=543 RepID=UPI0013D237CF|nr:macro domain-containing protein [Klebsiella aerogenes]EKU7810786.1 macro domain-containing protein [Klebsiella aerogenes]HCT2635090.1 macro domain-containing protein [Enterobacter roggenkampii]HDR2407687.1 macro domain-containing protein [Enterobacter asburiae]